MRKKQIANFVMIAIILTIAAAGVLTVGYIQGWFDQNDGKAAVLADIRGIVNLQREGVSYPVREETILRTGDQITCESGTTAVICAGESYLTLGEKAGIEVVDPSIPNFTASVTAGEVFVNSADAVTLLFDGKEISFTEAVASLSVRSGAQSISVFAGIVEDAAAGQMLDWVGNTLSVTKLSIKSLNDFHIAQIRIANESKILCFTNNDLDQLTADRWTEMQAQVNLTKPTIPNEAQPPETTGSTLPMESAEPAQGDSQPQQTDSPETNPQATTPPATETKPVETVPPAIETAPQETKPVSTETAPPETEPVPTETVPPETEPTPTETVPPETEVKLKCTISIRCDTILQNWDQLDPAKAGFVPSDGWILYAVVEFTEGETVFDVLKRACSDYGIQLEYSYTPIYSSYYIEGINNLYEFDCGSQSGWMYKVNGWFPNYGCSGYPLSDGDVIVWCYTCNGYGADVGA